MGGYEHNLGDGTLGVDTVTKYYVALSRTLAYRKNGVLYWVGTDHLGGTLRVTDSNFNPLDQMRYTPYGIARDPGANLGTDHLFTGQIDDQRIGLYWYATRAYDPTLGRFCCPDSVVPSESDPQSLNRYSYARNNPCARIDPTGHWDLSKQSDRADARKALGAGYVVDATSIYNRSSGVETNAAGRISRSSGRTNTPPTPIADAAAVAANFGHDPSQIPTAYATRPVLFAAASAQYMAIMAQVLIPVLPNRKCQRPRQVRNLRVLLVALLNLVSSPCARPGSRTMKRSV
jgi:RHS repeat-associated protein